jgi:hypothetical protein
MYANFWKIQNEELKLQNSLLAWNLLLLCLISLHQVLYVWKFFTVQ